MRRLPVLVLALATSLLAGCGFEPLYAERGGAGVVDRLAGVAIAPIPDRLGQLVHNRLSQGVTPQGTPAAITHRLEVDLLQSIEGFGFRSDEAITRERVRLIAHYRLIDTASDEVVVAETTHADTSIDVLLSDFATYSAEQAAGERNARQVADAILARIALYMRALDGQRAAATP
ncbi:MAG: hypothetical protein D6782_06865 [Alphaproteobacteria bacterium]|nr:MAG: hypothetical protein D6782_06865 [Alphaproteobacteria bacterium]